MEYSIPQYKSFLWHLDIEPFTWHTFYGEQCPSFVTEDNKEAWKRYLTKIVKKYLKAEVLKTPEFMEIETKVNYERWNYHLSTTQTLLTYEQNESCTYTFTCIYNKCAFGFSV